MIAVHSRPGAASARIARLSRPPLNVCRNRPPRQTARHGGAPERVQLLIWAARVPAARLNIFPAPVPLRGETAVADRGDAAARQHAHTGDVGSITEPKAAERDGLSQRVGVRRAIDLRKRQHTANAAAESDTAGRFAPIPWQAAESIVHQRQAACDRIPDPDRYSPSRRSIARMPSASQRPSSCCLNANVFEAAQSPSTSVLSPLANASPAIHSQ